MTAAHVRIAGERSQRVVTEAGPAAMDAVQTRLATEPGLQLVGQLIDRAHDDGKAMIHRVAADLQRVREAGQVDRLLSPADEVEQIAHFLHELLFGLGRQRNEPQRVGAACVPARRPARVPRSRCGHWCRRSRTS